jgi:hypothetical protein
VNWIIIGLVAIGCTSAGFVAGAVWQSLSSTEPDPDYDPSEWIEP